MNASAIIFYLISAFILGTGLLAVTTTKIFRSAIWLLFSLIGIAGLYFWMEVEFIAAVQVVVYVGGIVVLIIFSIFLTHKSGEDMPKPIMKRNIFAILAALFGLVFTYRLIDQYGGFKQVSAQPFRVEVGDIGSQMLSTTQYGFVLPFEVVSMLLLAAMIGCIVIAMKGSTVAPGVPVGKPEGTPTIKPEEVAAKHLPKILKPAPVEGEVEETVK